MFRRLRRILFHTAALASALLLLAILILWPVSYFRYDRLDYDAPAGWTCFIMSAAGRIGGGAWDSPASRTGFTFSPSRHTFTDSWHGWSYRDPSEFASDVDAHKFLGCACYVHHPGSEWYPARWILIPYSYLAILSAIMPTFWLLTRKRRRRSERLADGLCPHCSYDLRAHKPGEKCPECGTLIEPPK